MNRLLRHVLEDNAEDGDEDRDVEADDDADNDLDEGEDSNIEANKQVATDGEDGADESTDNLTVKYAVSRCRDMYNARATHPRAQNRGMTTLRQAVTLRSRMTLMPVKMN